MLRFALVEDKKDMMRKMLNKIVDSLLERMKIDEGHDIVRTNFLRLLELCSFKTFFEGTGITDKTDFVG